MHECVIAYANLVMHKCTNMLKRTHKHAPAADKRMVNIEWARPNVTNIILVPFNSSPTNDFRYSIAAFYFFTNKITSSILLLPFILSTIK